MRRLLLILWLTLTATAATTATPLPTANSMRAPRFVSADWSPDGRYIAIVQESEERLRLILINANGSRAQTLKLPPITDEATGSLLRLDGSSNLNRLEWSPDSKQLAILERHPLVAASYEFLGGAFLLPADGRKYQRIDIKTPELDDLAWSPDGKRLVVAANRNVFLAGGNKERRGDLWLVDAAAGKERKLGDSPGNISHLSWSPSGKHLAYVARPEWNRIRAAVIQTTLDVRRSVILSRLPADPDRYFAAWSPDGSQFVYTARGPKNADILELVRPYGGSRRTVPYPNGTLLGLHWPRRNRLLAVTHSAPSEVAHIYEINPATRRVREITRVKSLFEVFGWSPDGRFLAYRPFSLDHIHRLDLQSEMTVNLTKGIIGKPL